MKHLESITKVVGIFGALVAILDSRTRKLQILDRPTRKIRIFPKDVPAALQAMLVGDRGQRRSGEQRFGEKELFIIDRFDRLFFLARRRST